MSETNLALGFNLHMCRWYHIYAEGLRKYTKKSILKKFAKFERAR